MTALIAASGMTAPDGSVTCPVSVERNSCALARLTNKKKQANPAPTKRSTLGRVSFCIWILPSDRNDYQDPGRKGAHSPPSNEAIICFKIGVSRKYKI